MDPDGFLTSTESYAKLNLYMCRDLRHGEGHPSFGQSTTTFGVSSTAMKLLQISACYQKVTSVNNVFCTPAGWD